MIRWVFATIHDMARRQRVLTVLRARDARLGPDAFRRCLRRTGSAEANLVTVMTSVEVACVAGVDGVEAVVIRYTRTARLCAVNASAFLSCNDSTRSGDKVPSACSIAGPSPWGRGARVRVKPVR